MLFHGQTSVFDACIQIEQQVPDHLQSVISLNSYEVQKKESSVNYNFHTYKFFDEGEPAVRLTLLFYFIHLLIWIKLVPEFCTLNFVDEVLKNHDTNSNKTSKNKR